MKPRNINEILAVSYPDREFFLEPLIYPGCLAMIHSQTGVGKTRFTVHLALSVASCTPFIKWPARRAARVLYIDGEILERDMQTYLAPVVESVSDFNPDNFKYLTLDYFPDGTWLDIADERWQKYLDKIMIDRDVLFIDNLGCCSERRPKETDEETWGRIKPWLLQLRRAGKSVYIVHHSSKTGGYYGTSLMTRYLNFILHLVRPVNYDASDGAKFEVRFEKTRNFKGSDVEPLILQLRDAHKGVAWDWRSLKSTLDEQIRELKSVLGSDIQVARELQVPLSTIKKALKDVTPVSHFQDEEEIF